LWHSCWCISFVCWNSNSSLNSIVCIPFKPKTRIPKPFPILSLFSPPILYSPLRSRPAQQLARAARQLLAGRHPASAALQPSIAPTAQLANPARPSSASPLPPPPRPRSMTCGAQGSSPTPRRPRPGLHRRRPCPSGARVPRAWPERQGVRPGYLRPPPPPGPPTRATRAAFCPSREPPEP
jgi:hypothetical protein